MQQIYPIFNKSNILKVLYILLFYIFITPFSLNINTQGVSANYLFIFFPILVFFIKKEIAWPPKSVLIFAVFLSLIFLYGIVFEVENHHLFLRRSASFLIFMSVFALMLVKLDSDMVQSFKLALILWSLTESYNVIYEFISIDANSLGFYAKGILGSQRIGFIYLMGFWALATLKVQNNLVKIVKFVSLYIILVGLFMTYSRSSMAGLAISIGVYYLYLLIYLFKSTLSFKQALSKFLVKSIYLIVLILSVHIFFYGATNFYGKTIFKLLFASQSEIYVDDTLSRYTSADWDMIEDELGITASQKLERIQKSEEEKAVIDKLVLENMLQLKKAQDRLKLAQESIKEKVIKADAEVQSIQADAEVQSIQADAEVQSIQADAEVQSIQADAEVQSIQADATSQKEEELSEIAQLEKLKNDVKQIELENRLQLMKAKDGLKLAQELGKEKVVSQDIDILTTHYLKELRDDNILILPSLREFFDYFMTQIINRSVIISVEKDLVSTQKELERIKKINSTLQISVAKYLQAEYLAKDVGNENDIANANENYLIEVKKEKATYSLYVEIQDKLKGAKTQKKLVLYRLLENEFKTTLIENQKTSETNNPNERPKYILTEQEESDIIATVKDIVNISMSLDKDLNPDESALKARSRDQGSSLGYRVYMHKLVFTETLKRPFVGSSFLGVWSLFENQQGSTHSQYLDILFRVGVVAFIAFLIFIYKVSLYLLRKDIGLFVGFMGLLGVGLFHETIKLSQGGFIFAFLLAMWAQNLNILKDNEESY